MNSNSSNLASFAVHGFFLLCWVIYFVANFKWEDVWQNNVFWVTVIILNPLVGLCNCLPYFRPKLVNSFTKWNKDIKSSSSNPESKANMPSSAPWIEQKALVVKLIRVFPWEERSLKIKPLRLNSVGTGSRYQSYFSSWNKSIWHFCYIWTLTSYRQLLYPNNWIKKK